MIILKEHTLDDSLVKFPPVEEIESFGSFKNTHYDFYFTALGFEERTLSIPDQLAEISSNGFTCNEIIYFTYSTSTNDNAFNEPRLRSAFEKFRTKSGVKSNVTNLMCDEDSFNDLLINIITRNIDNKKEHIKILLDISVNSSRLILDILRILFEINHIDLTVVYTEAEQYFPLFEEFSRDKEKFLEDSELSTTNGYESIINSNEYSEGTKEYPDLIIAFAPFKVGRINKIVSDIDESILLNDDNRLIWIVGKPNFENENDRENRISMLKEINGINSETSNTYFLSTLDYRETLTLLENLYQSRPNYHYNIADLGSKMQTLAISIFYHIRPDVSVYYALPRKYNPSRYSHGIKRHWKIRFGELDEFYKLLSRIDNIEIELSNNTDYPFFE